MAATRVGPLGKALASWEPRRRGRQRGEQTAAQARPAPDRTAPALVLRLHCTEQYAGAATGSRSRESGKRRRGGTGDTAGAGWRNSPGYFSTPRRERTTERSEVVRASGNEVFALLDRTGTRQLSWRWRLDWLRPPLATSARPSVIIFTSAVVRERDSPERGCDRCRFLRAAPPRMLWFACGTAVVASGLMPRRQHTESGNREALPQSFLSWGGLQRPLLLLPGGPIPL